MNQARQEQIRHHIDTFPVLPTNVAELMAVTNDPESSIQDLINVILPDQSLCLSILKIANSALFGLPKKVESINRAVAILGFNEVERIALTKAFINSFNKLSRKHKVYIDKFWQHSFLCGLMAKKISEELYISADTAFMGGLIHDIGKLVMLATFEGEYSADFWMSQISTAETQDKEIHMFAFTHDQVGGDLLKKWLFPDSLIDAVEFHHRPEQALVAKKIAYMIQLADILSFYCCNQELLESGDITDVIIQILPDFHSTQLFIHYGVDDTLISEWFHWLRDNYEKGSNIKDAFMS